MKMAPTFRALRFGSVLVLLMAFMAPSALRAEDKDNYDESKEEIRLPNRTLDLWCAKPRNPRSPTFLVVFASGDGGMHGVSKATYKHMAEQGYYVAAFSSSDALKRVKSTGQLGTFPEAAAAVTRFIQEAKRLLGLPESTPVVVTGVSRGASFVVFAAGEPSLQPQICGAVAIALTRESDYMKPPDPAERGPHIKLDEKGGILLYPALARLGSIPVAVIQSTHDSYVPAEESRQLMGPDTPTRRLYEVQASNHSFGGGREQLFHDLDEALNWIASTMKHTGSQ
jgi:dienelactone hydrolase